MSSILKPFSAGLAVLVLGAVAWALYTGSPTKASQGNVLQRCIDSNIWKESLALVSTSSVDDKGNEIPASTIGCDNEDAQALWIALAPTVSSDPKTTRWKYEDKREVEQLLIGVDSECDRFVADSVGKPLQDVASNYWCSIHLDLNDAAMKMLNAGS